MLWIDVGSALVSAGLVFINGRAIMSESDCHLYRGNCFSWQVSIMDGSNLKLSSKANRHGSEAKLQTRWVADARLMLPSLNGSFQLIFRSYYCRHLISKPSFAYEERPSPWRYWTQRKKGEYARCFNIKSRRLFGFLIYYCSIGDSYNRAKRTVCPPSHDFYELLLCHSDRILLNRRLCGWHVGLM